MFAIRINSLLSTFFSFITSFCISFSPSFLESATPTPEGLIVKRIQSHLLIQDPTSACKEANDALKIYPQNEHLLEAYIKSLAKTGNEKDMMLVWERYASSCPTAYKNRELLEDMAWAVITQGSTSSLPLIRIMGLLGAFFAQDAKGVDVLHRSLHDTSSLVRAVGVELSGNLNDAKLCDEVLRLLREESVWKVRLQVIKAIGKMKISIAKPELIAIVADDRNMAEEKVAAIQALVHLLDTAERAEVVKLATSDRAGLRMLACQLVEHFELNRDLDCIVPLLKDHSCDVRASALKVLGKLRIRNYQGTPVIRVVEAMLNDPDTTTAITAAWVLTLNDLQQGQKAFTKWLKHDNRDVRIQAAAALGACGKYAFPLLLTVFRESSDPYVRMNLALSLIGQQKSTEDACTALYEGLINVEDRWMWKDYDFCRALSPSNLKYIDAGDDHPEAASQLVHLDILNIIAIMKCPKAQEAVAQFLQQKTWGITGMASALLLTEGDEEALDLVTNMLNHPEHKVRVQSALILALWGRDEKVIAILQGAYRDGDRDLKEKILEGIGHVGAQSSIPFLLDKLKEHHQSLRIIAASALLQCLYH